ncbi:MAG: MBL fold metallo-hydrolase [Chloroflexi bacterium]|nr:MBL fold metallo-hydrolase [Chloroflexota bacterium]
MALAAWALASGSAGNAFLVSTPRTSLLVDAGISLATLAKARSAWLWGRPLDAIVLTHEHQDHARNALAIATALNAPLYATPGTHENLAGQVERYRAVDRRNLRPGQPQRIGDIEIIPRSIVHDASDPIGLTIEHDGAAIAIAVDMGTLRERDIEWMARADLLVIEANHDLDKLWDGPYPRNLKARIASGRGHLSNSQAAAAAFACARRGRVREVWLAHLSETNNSADTALATVLRALQTRHISVRVCDRCETGVSWSCAGSYRQMALL